MNPFGTLSTLTLFGRFELRTQSRVVTLPTRKGEALLALLSLSADRCAGREDVTAMLWSDVPRTQGRHSLRQTIHAVRRELTDAGIGTLNATRDTVSLAAPQLAIDVVNFCELMKAATPDALDTAIALARGDLLEGFSVREPPFDQWLAAQRARLSHLTFDAHIRRLDLLRADGEIDRALQVAHKLLAIQPQQDGIQRLIEQLLARRARGALNERS